MLNKTQHEKITLKKSCFSSCSGTFFHGGLVAVQITEATQP